MQKLNTAVSVVGIPCMCVCCPPPLPFCLQGKQLSGPVEITGLGIEGRGKPQSGCWQSWETVHQPDKIPRASALSLELLPGTLQLDSRAYNARNQKSEIRRSHDRKVREVKRVASVLDPCRRQTKTLQSHSSVCFLYTHRFCVNNILLILQEKVKPAQAPPFFNEGEKEEKEDLPDTAAKSNRVEDTLWCLEEPEAVPVPGGTDVAGQQTKEKVRDFLTLI